MKLFTHLAFIILAAFITACSSDEKESAELVEMHFRAVMPDSNLSKSVGSGNLVNVLYVEAISNTGKKVRYEFPVTSGYVDARISLAKGLIYDIIFWAQRKENNPYDNRDLTAIKMNLPTAMTNVLAMEQYDAFYATLRNIPAEDKAVTDVDLRGMTADEAIMVLDNAIDGAMLSGIHQITVIHGKGTGVLRREVQAFLKKHKAIRTFRLGTYGEGESGVTIAELK